VDQPPYQPSWINRFFAWLDARAFPSPLFYLLVYLAFVSLTHIVLWRDGALPTARINTRVLFDMVWVPLGLGSLHILQQAAGRSVEEFRPVLNVTQDDFEKIVYRFTTFPAWPVGVLSLIGLIFGLLNVSTLPMQPDLLVSGSLSSIVWSTLSGSGYAFTPVWIYTAFRQLIQINQLYGRVERINLFNLQPLYGLASVAMIIAGFFVIVGNLNYALEMFLGTRTMTTAGVIQLSGLILTMAAIVTVVPLLGIHRKIGREKRYLLAVNADQVEDLRLLLESELTARKFDQIQNIDKGLSALFAMRANIRAVPAWPWSPGTLRNFGTAILLPLVIWLAQRLLAPLF